MNREEWFDDGVDRKIELEDKLKDINDSIELLEEAEYLFKRSNDLKKIYNDLVTNKYNVINDLENLKNEKVIKRINKIKKIKSKL